MKAFFVIQIKFVRYIFTEQMVGNSYKQAKKCGLAVFALVVIWSFCRLQPGANVKKWVDCCQLNNERTSWNDFGSRASAGAAPGDESKQSALYITKDNCSKHNEITTDPLNALNRGVTLIRLIHSESSFGFASCQKCPVLFSGKNNFAGAKPLIKLNKSKYLLPILRNGPNNQLVGLRASIYVAIRLNRTMVLPKFFKHRSDRSVELQSNVLNITLMILGFRHKLRLGTIFNLCVKGVAAICLILSPVDSF